MAGLYLDPWQQLVLCDMLGERADGTWASFENGICCPRQNGKDGILEARELAGLFLLPEKTIIHSAHLADTAEEHFDRLKNLIEGCPDLSRRVKNSWVAHGKQGIELRDGSRIRFRTRTAGGGRGFSGDLVIMNEAMILSTAMMGSLLPILSTRPNAQIIYAGSAVDQTIHEHGYVLSRVRARAIAGTSPRLAYFEWGVEVPDHDGDPLGPDEIPESVAADPKVWAQANPALGIRISTEYMEDEREALDDRTFAVERLGVGDWFNVEDVQTVIDMKAWGDLADGDEPAMPKAVSWALDVSHDRSWASIAVSGRRDDGDMQVELVDRRRGTGWLVGRAVELTREHGGRVYVDGSSPAASLIPELEEAGVDVEEVSSSEHAEACGLLFDAVEDRTVRHLGEQPISSALRGAVKRDIGDAWVWSRKKSTADVSALVAVTLAHWGFVTNPPAEKEPLIAFV